MVRALPGGQQLQKGMAESFLRPWVRETFLRPGARESFLRPGARETFLRPGARESFLRPWAREASSPEQRSKDNKAMKAWSRTDIPLEANKIHPQNSKKKVYINMNLINQDQPRQALIL